MASSGITGNYYVKKLIWSNALLCWVFANRVTYRIPLAADVKKAFLTVSVCEEDHDALCFLWVDNIEKSVPDIQEMRFTQVIYGVSSSPFLLSAIISYHLQSKCRYKYPDLVDTLCTQFMWVTMF